MLFGGVRCALLQERSGKFCLSRFTEGNTQDVKSQQQKRTDVITGLLDWCESSPSSWYQAVLLFDRLLVQGAFSSDAFGWEIDLVGWSLVCASLISQVNDYDGWSAPHDYFENDDKDAVDHNVNALRRQAEIHVLVQSEGILHGPTIEIFLSQLRVIMADKKVFGTQHSDSYLWVCWTDTARKIIYQTHLYLVGKNCPSLVAIGIVYTHYLKLLKSNEGGDAAMGKWPTGFLFRTFHHSLASVEECITSLIDPILEDRPHHIVVPLPTKGEGRRQQQPLVIREWDASRDDTELAGFEDSKAYLGRGTYGIVYSTPLLANKAVKRMKLDSDEGDGCPDYATIREIGIAAQTYGLKNLCQAQEIVLSPTHMYLIMPKYQCTLKYWIAKTWEATLDMPNLRQECAGKCKSILWQIAKGVFALHEKDIAHRDLHPGNILCDQQQSNDDRHRKRGKTAISCVVADFGLARHVNSEGNFERMHYSSEVQSLYYRAPEVLLGKADYTTAIDCWSLGCIMHELFMLAFRAKPAHLSEFYAFYWPDSTKRLMANMMLRLGKPSEETWPGCTKMPNYASFCETDTVTPTVSFSEPFRTNFAEAPLEGISLLQGLLTFDPTKRLTIQQVLRHPYFSVRQ